MRKIQWALAACLPLVTAGLTGAGERVSLPVSEIPPQQVSDNQQLANELATLIRQSGDLHGYAVDIETVGGVVTLKGQVADGAQHSQLVSMTRRYPGVVAVNDQVRVEHQQRLLAANYQPEAPRALPVPPASEAAPSATPILEPQPITSFAGGISPYADAPVVPPYSWPAYTPYNNFASMAYQTQYPSGAWPFIGPPYPYPMIPSGWRKVTLKWKSGYWWLKFRAH